MRFHRFSEHVCALATAPRRFRFHTHLAFFAALLLIASTARAEQFDFVTPPDSQAFGASVAVLPNGNVVVTDPYAGSAQTGAVYLYTSDGALISTLHGTTASDSVGLGGIVVLPSGNFVVFSPFWTNAGAAKAGAVTFVDGTHGLNAAISPRNSLVGSSPGDEVGYLFANFDLTAADFDLTGLTLLANGNYLIVSPQWSNTSGAVTWGDGSRGVNGVVSAANSLIGTVAGDAIGGAAALKNGNYVVTSPNWHNGSVAGAGAVTWGNGTIGTHGAVSASNSLVGSSTADSVGTQVSELANGNFVIASPTWSSVSAKAVGAVTWASGTKPTVGAVSSANSLTGTLENDLVGYGFGYGGVYPLSNGNYVIASPRWSASVGAVTWGDANGKTIGAVSSANSMIGTIAGDNVGSIVTPLANGNYVVVNRAWHNSDGASVGAATWVDGSAPFSGAVSAANSLTGAASRDGEEMTAVALANGNYVVADPSWKNSGAGPLRADGYGSVTWGDGSIGVRDVISSANSLTGSKFGDLVGGIYPLNNGNYVVVSPWWSSSPGQVPPGTITWADGSKVTSGQIGSQNSLLGASVPSVTTLANGDYVVHSGMASTTTGYAITRCNGTSPTTGPVSPLNSLVGNNSGDLSVASVIPLDDSSFIVDIPAWHNNRGAVTWVGPLGLTGIVSASNSVIGSSENDLLGSNALISIGPDPVGTPRNGGVMATGNGNYIVTSPYWSNGSMHEAGAVTLGHPGQLVGAVNVNNSVMGSVAFGGADLVSAYDASRDRLVVGQPDANRVTILGSHLTPPQFDLNQHGLTGSWFNPATGGQGLEIEVYPDAGGSGKPVLFGGWFTFDTAGAGNPRWYAMQGTPGAAARTFDIDIATGYGGAFAQPPVVTGSVVGHGTLTFNDCSSGVLTYTLNDGASRSGTMPLSRLIANVTCSASGDRGPPGSYLLSGSWFDPASSGQGLIVEVNPVQPYLFAAWYTFTPNGNGQDGADGQRWYTLQFGALTAGDTHIDQIGIYTASGGRFDAPAPVTVQLVGSASLSIDSCQSMTLGYVFNAGVNAGRTGAVHLVRTGPAPEGCSL